MSELDRYLKYEASRGGHMKKMIVPFEIAGLSDEGTITGYGSTFGGAPDSYGDIIVRGAFQETIAKGGRNGNGIVMLWNHDAKEPIGKWHNVSENEKGLKMEGKLVMEVARAREAYALAKEKVVQGLSIGWDFIRDKDGRVEKDAVEIDEKKRTRYLKRVELFEVSLVTFPANTRATITGTKGLECVNSIRDLEMYLRDEGLSSSAAKTLISKTREVSGMEKSEEMEAALKIVLEGFKTQNARLFVADMLSK